MTPLSDRVIVQPFEPLSKTDSGFVIPNSERERPCKGVVVSVGKGKKIGETREPMEVKVNDVVVFSKYAGQSFPTEPDKPELLIMRESEILAIE